MEFKVTVFVLKNEKTQISSQKIILVNTYSTKGPGSEPKKLMNIRLQKKEALDILQAPKKDDV